MEAERTTEGDGSEIRSFARRVLERHGALVEEKADSLFTLLPRRLSLALDLPEEARLGRGGEPLLYGTPLLDRLVRLVTDSVSIVYGGVKVAYLKKEGFDVRLSEDLSFVNSRIRLVQRAETRAAYMRLACRYVALSDERKEGIIQVFVREETGARIHGLARRLNEYEVECYAPGKVPPHFPACPDRAIRAALKEARAAAEAELGGFLDSMRRHLRRDVKNTREYYRALEKEMRENLNVKNASPEQRGEREAKIRELPGEAARKIEDLKKKYRVEVTLTACTALRLLVPVVILFVEVQHRTFRRRLPVAYNPVTRRLDPLACESCGETVRKVFPFVERSRIRLRCESCTRR